jgi:hypothetical protein
MQEQAFSKLLHAVSEAAWNQYEMPPPERMIKRGRFSPRSRAGKNCIALVAEQRFLKKKGNKAMRPLFQRPPRVKAS